MQLNYRWLIPALISGLIWFGIGQLARSDSPHLQLQTDPPLAEMVPLHQPVRLTLRAADSAGQMLTGARFQVRLQTPAKTPWLTSDFPLVEGTTLLELAAIAPDGQLQFEQVLPIRGTYQLAVRAEPQQAGAFAPIAQTFQLQVPENPIKYRNVLILVGILLAAGLGSGWAIGADQSIHAIRDGEVAPPAVRLWLSGAIVVAIVILLIVNISAELAAAHGEHHPGDLVTPAAPAIQQVSGLEARLLGDSTATVGQLATHKLQIHDANQTALADIPFHIRSISLENQQTLFAYQGVSTASGDFTWKEQFFDGTPHQIQVNLAPSPDASPSFQPLQLSQIVDVEAIEPPLMVRLISLFYFTAIFSVGMAIGFWRRRVVRALGD